MNFNKWFGALTMIFGGLLFLDYVFNSQPNNGKIVSEYMFIPIVGIAVFSIGRILYCTKN